MVDKIKERIILFSKYIESINSQFISQHLTGYVDHGWVYYRDSSRDWYSKTYVPQLDDSQKILDREPTGHYVISGTRVRDNYVYELLSSYRVECRDEPYKEEIDELLLQENINSWKREILKSYNREEHIQYFILDNMPLQPEWNAIREEIYAFAKEIIINSKSIDLDVVQYGEMTFRITDYVRKEVELIRCGGIWGRVSNYGYGKPCLNDQKTIRIPKEIYTPCLTTLSVTSIAQSVFEYLTDCEEIYLPVSMRNIKWSFWHCRKLQNIFTEGYGSLCSMDGVLYDNSRKKLIAYPNNHSVDYVVPDGVEEICNLAFKDCDNLKTLTLPSSIKSIGLNAFYRCENLSDIYCKGTKNSILFEGFQGNFGEVNPTWHYETNI